VDSKLYFSSPNNFNDPLDCRVAFTFNASSLDIIHFWRRLGREHASSIPKRDRNRIASQWAIKSKTPEGQAELSKQFHESIAQHGIACFSESPSNLLLWSYYAEGHTGISIRFNTKHDIFMKMPKFILPIKVRYQKDFPEIDYYKSSTMKIINTCFRTKSEEWIHEEEWRLVSEGMNGIIRIPSEMIDGVILGMRIDKAAENEIRQWIQSRRNPIELLRVENCTNSYQLEVISMWNGSELRGWLPFEIVAKDGFHFQAVPPAVVLADHCQQNKSQLSISRMLVP
jgi:hypothetical protein